MDKFNYYKRAIDFQITTDCIVDISVGRQVHTDSQMESMY